MVSRTFSKERLFTPRAYTPQDGNGRSPTWGIVTSDSAAASSQVSSQSIAMSRRITRSNEEPAQLSTELAAKYTP